MTSRKRQRKGTEPTEEEEDGATAGGGAAAAAADDEGEGGDDGNDGDVDNDGPTEDDEGGNEEAETKADDDEEATTDAGEGDANAATPAAAEEDEEEKADEAEDEGTGTIGGGGRPHASRPTIQWIPEGQAPVPLYNAKGLLPMHPMVMSTNPKSAAAEKKARASTAYSTFLHVNSAHISMIPAPRPAGKDGKWATEFKRTAEKFDLAVFRSAVEYIGNSKSGQPSTDLAIAAIDILAARRAEAMRVFEDSERGSTANGRLFKGQAIHAISFVSAPAAEAEAKGAKGEKKKKKPKKKADRCVLGSESHEHSRNVRPVTLVLMPPCDLDAKWTTWSLSHRSKIDMAVLDAFSLIKDIHIYIYFECSKIGDIPNITPKKAELALTDTIGKLARAYRSAWALFYRFFTTSPVGT